MGTGLSHITAYHAISYDASQCIILRLDVNIKLLSNALAIVVTIVYARGCV